MAGNVFRRFFETAFTSQRILLETELQSRISQSRETVTKELEDGIERFPEWILYCYDRTRFEGLMKCQHSIDFEQMLFEEEEKLHDLLTTIRESRERCRANILTLADNKCRECAGMLSGRTSNFMRILARHNEASADRLFQDYYGQQEKIIKKQKDAFDIHLVQSERLFHEQNREIIRKISQVNTVADMRLWLTATESSYG